MDNDIFAPQIPEPTEKEIDETIKKAKEMHGISMRRSDGAKYAKLYNELKWWFTAEKAYDSRETISEDIAKEIKEYVKEKRGREISLEEAYTEADKSLRYTIPHEKERIANELRAIITNYK